MPYKDPEKAKKSAAERYLKNIEDRKAKMREAYLKNREDRLIKSKMYADQNKIKLKEYHKTYRLENKEKAKEYKKQYYQENREELIKLSVERTRNNPEGQRKRSKKYRGTEKGKVKFQIRRNARRKRERHASLGMKFHKEILSIYAECKSKCIETGEMYEVDHIIPITHSDVSGLHVPWNLRIVLREVNRRKTNKWAFIDGEELL